MRRRDHYTWWGEHVGYSEYREMPPRGKVAWPWVIAAIVAWGFAMNGTLFVWLGLGLLIVAIWITVRRGEDRARECAERGWHDPYRPVEGFPDLRCWDCGCDLPSGYESHRDVRRVAEKVRQSYYSDRR